MTAPTPTKIKQNYEEIYILPMSMDTPQRINIQ